MDVSEKIYKMLIIHINDSQSRRLEEFLERIDIYNYTISGDVKRAVSEKIKQKQSKTWPGSSTEFFVPIKETKIDEFLINLKTFRMALPKGVIISIWIVPFDRVIKSLYEEEIPVNEELLEELKDEYRK